LKLDPIGLVEDTESVDLEPITLTICGLSLKTRENVCEEFNCQPTLPWGNTFAAIEAVESGNTNMAWNAIKWLRSCLMDDSERDRLQAFLMRSDVAIEQSTMDTAYSTLAETYTGRPTLPRSASTGGGAKTEPTSKAGSRAKASGSKGSRSAKP